MSQPIQRDGVWWHQKADGTWLRWNAPKSEWEAAPAPPPPPPAPPQESGKSIGFVPDSTAKGREPAFGFSTAESDEPSSTVAPEGTDEVSWEFGEDSGEPFSFGPANADVLPPESDKPTASEWLNDNRAVAALVALVVLAAAVFAAFTFMGGDDGTTGDRNPEVSSPLPTKAAARKLNALCSSAKRRMNAVATPTTPDEMVSYMGKVRSEYKGILRELRGFKTGPKDRSAFNQIVEDIEKTLRYADRIVSAAQAGDEAEFQQTLLELDSFSNTMRGHARAFGADACATA
jgi:hypothetical protein